MHKRCFSLVIALLLCALLAVPSVADQANPRNTFPIVTEPLTLKFVTWYHPVTSDFNELQVWNTYEEMTGIDIEWIQIPLESFTERRNLIFATGDLPDAFYKGNLSNQQIVEYAREGFLISLNDLIEQGNAPSLTQLFERLPGMRKAITQDDGNIYSLGYFNDCSSLSVGTRMFINRVWMKNVGIEQMPATVDELIALLRAFRENDANGNGDVTDEIPYGGQGIETVYVPLAGAFGLNNHGHSNGYIDTGDDGALRFIPTSESYRKCLGVMQLMYSEGLIDREIMTITAETNIANASTNRYGVIAGVNSQVAGTYETDYAGLPSALVGPDGDQIYSAVSAMVFGAGHFSITSANKHPAETLRWVDYFYSEEGSALLLLGIKGVTYDTDADGNNYYLDWIMNDPNGRTFDEMIGTFTSWGGGGNPVVLLDNTFLGGEAQPIPRAAAQALKPYLPTEVWEAFTFNEEESEVLSTLGNDINNYITEMMAQFVTGKASLETDWDSYVAEYQKMGLDKYLAVYESAYSRYLAK